MRTETDPVTGTQAGAAPLGAEERSDEAPRGEVGQGRPRRKEIEGAMTASRQRNPTR